MSTSNELLVAIAILATAATVPLTSWCVVADHFRTGFLRMETKAQEKADSSQEKRSEMHQDMYLGN